MKLLQFQYIDRLNFELKVIEEKNMLDYFLVVWELIRFCEKNNISTGPGRGSAAGCLLSWCLDITQIDSLHFDLFFERFMNPERKCLTNKNYILMADGSYKKIDKLKIDDIVQAETGEAKVLEIVKRKIHKNEKVYEIETVDGAKIELTGNHIIPIIRNNQRIEVRVDELKETDFLFTF